MARRRILSPATSDAALASAGACRSAAVKLMTEAPIGGPAYRAAEELLRAIDGLAEALTGEADHFHTRPHTAGG